jgi:hypothetical protein
MVELVYGVGINDASYKVTKTERGQAVWYCPYYTTWKSMLSRCYPASCKKKYPSYEGAQVCDSWLRFSNFRSWMMEQQWIEFSEDDECKIERKQLDKDLLSGKKRGKLYSPNTCVFVSNRINVFLLDRKGARGSSPLGVCKHSKSKKYRAQVNNPFTKEYEYLGLFPSPEIAQAFYIARKKEFAKQLSEEETDPRVKDALLSLDFSH